MVKIIPFSKKYIVKAKHRDGDTVEFTLDHQPNAAELRDILDTDNLCEDFEYIYVFKNRKRVYTYPCRRKRTEERKEDEITKIARELLIEKLKRVLNEERKEYTIHDLLAQFYNDIDLAEKLSEKISSRLKKESSSDFDKFIEFITKMMNLVPQISSTVKIPVQQNQTQISQEDIKKIENILSQSKVNLNPESVSEGYEKMLKDEKPPCEELTGEKCMESGGENV